MNPVSDTIIIRCSSCGKKLAEIEYFPHVEAIQCLNCGSSTTAQVNTDYTLKIICLTADDRNWFNPNQRNADKEIFREKFMESFSDGELRALCFDSGIDYETLPGTSKIDKVIEIILHFERRNRMAELVNIVKQERPKISW